MWRSYLARVLVWFVALAGLGLYAEAQTNTGNVYGNVIDESGGALPGGTATLTGERQPMTTSVDAQGLFRFLKVPPGKYTLTVAMPGFTTLTRENVIVSVGSNTQVDVQLRLSAVQEAVTVTSATPLIDPRQVETGQNFSRDELQEIPTSRDVWSLIQQVPGVQVDTVNVGGNQSALAGGPDMITKGSGNVVYQVDGATTTDNTYGNPFQRQNGGTNTFFDFATFQDVEVSTGGSLVEQQTSGVTINVVTKRGTNEFHGAARYSYASGNWQSNNTPQEAIDQGITTDSTRMLRDYGADFGFPIARDKLWLWFAGGYQTIARNITSDPDEPAPPSKVNLEPWSAKLNWQVSAANAVQLYYQRSDREQSNTSIGATRAPLAATQLTIPTNFYKVEDSHVFSADLFASVFLASQNPNYTDLGNGSLGCNNVPFEIACNGDQSRDAYWIDPQYQNNYSVLLGEGPAEAGQRPGLQVLQHRQHQPRAEVQLQLPPADRGLGHGLARHSERGLGILLLLVQYRVAQPRRPAGLQEPDLERDARRHAHGRQSHGPAGSPLRPSAGQEPSGPGVRERGVPGAAAGGAIPRSRRTGSSTSRTGSRASRRRTRSARGKTPCSGPPTRSSPTRSVSSATTGAVCRYPTATTTTGPTSTATTSCNPTRSTSRTGSTASTTTSTRPRCRTSRTSSIPI